MTINQERFPSQSSMRARAANAADMPPKDVLISSLFEFASEDDFNDFLA